MKNRNLFIQLNRPQEKGIKETLVNSWTRPIPLQYHLLHSPILTNELADLVPKEQSISIFDVNQQPQKCTVKKKGKQRLRYMRLEEQLRFLHEFLEQFKDLHESELLLYKQTLLVRYLNKFLSEIKVECHEKSHFVQSIWNALIKIFQSLFERVVTESKRKEKDMLTDEINLHHEYQKKLQQLQQTNQRLIVTEAKYKGAISQLMDSVAAVNMELKGTKTLQEKSASTVKQLNLKYQELRSQYLDIVVSTGITRQEAEAKLYDRQLILFSRQIANKEAEVKIKPKQGRKARIIDQNIDVGLILEEIEAQQEYDFEIDYEEKKEAVMYSNQNVQTEQIKKSTKTVNIQSTYFDLVDLKLIKDKGIQTARKEPLFFVNQKIQTDETSLQQKNSLVFSRLFSLTIKQEKQQNVEELESIKLLKQTSASDPSQTILLEVSDSAYTEEPLFHGRQSIVSTVEKKISKRPRQSKMFRVGEGSRVSKIFPQKRLRTEGGRDSQVSNSVVQRASETKKVSEFILLEDIRKNIIARWNKFKIMSQKYNFFDQIQQQFSNHLGPNLSTKVIQIESSVFGRTSTFIQNVSLYRSNQHLSSKISAGINNKKGFIAGKSLKIVADILQHYYTFIKEGIYSLNLASFAIDYLGALKGQCLEAESKEKIFIEFMKSCLPLSVSSYLVKNFFLLCGFQISRGTRERRMSKMNLKIRDTDLEQTQIKYMYSSQVYAYFKLLAKANCDSSSDLLQAYTNAHVFLDSLQQLKKLYKNSDTLIQALQEVIKKTIEATGDPDPKLDIFKVLQFVIEKILSFKRQIAERLQPLAILYGELDNDFFTDILTILTQRPQQILIALRLHRVCYGGLSSLENISSLIIIQGLQLDIIPFLKIENDYKYSIMKRALCDNKSDNKMISSMIGAIVKKELKKPQFLCLLKMMWMRQAESVQEVVLGEDLLSLYEMGLGLTMERPKKDNFHWASFGCSE